MSNTKEISKREVIDAANALKSFCDKKFRFAYACDCPFADGDGCSIGSKPPCEYQIPCR